MSHKVKPEELVKIRDEIIPFLKKIRVRETIGVQCIDMSEFAFECLMSAIGDLEFYVSKKSKIIEIENIAEVKLEIGQEKRVEKKRRRRLVRVKKGKKS